MMFRLWQCLLLLPNLNHFHQSLGVFTHPQHPPEPVLVKCRHFGWSVQAWKRPYLLTVSQISQVVLSSGQTLSNLCTWWEGVAVFCQGGSIGVSLGVNDTPVFLLNEYIVELSPANFNILNQILNWIFLKFFKLNNFLNWIFFIE